MVDSKITLSVLLLIAPNTHHILSFMIVVRFVSRIYLVVIFAGHCQLQILCGRFGSVGLPEACPNYELLLKCNELLK